jgi:cell wall-associated NlpC family hydrolase
MLVSRPVIMLRSLRILFIYGSMILLAASCKTPGKLSNTNRSNNTAGADSFYTTYSNKLSIKLSGKEDKRLIKEVGEWLGTPYKYGGAGLTGTDCSGFTFSVFKTVYNISLYRSSADQVKNTESVSRNDLRCGDLVFFKISGDKVSHVGLYIADNKFIHASTKRGVVVNDLSEDYYTKHYLSSGRVKGLTGYK